jgi:DNA-binding response OmpR family regulator
VFKNGENILLSPTELKLFEFLISNLNKVISKEDILYYLHNGDEGSEAVLRVQISKLKKLGLKIYNQRGVGYKLEEL